MNTANYMQIAKQTYEEKVEMYMKSSKKELIEMLIACNEILLPFQPRYNHNEVIKYATKTETKINYDL